VHYELGQTNRLGNRESNQDRFAAVEGEAGVLLILADGMGGNACGDVAAEMLVAVARNRFLRHHGPIPHPGTFFTEVIQTAHHAIIQHAEKQALRTPPGTTGVLCLVREGRMAWGHVGDSRLYLFRDGRPIYRTTDHSYVEQLYQQGRISRLQQARHPKRNHITQCIGGLSRPPEVTLGHGKALEPGDVILLCSDGLWSALEDADLGRLLREGEDLEQALEAMATRAEQISYPHSDNISAVALRLLSLQAPAPAATPPRPDSAGKPHADSELAEAIARIEQVLREYEDEFDR